ncbi:tetratricopeptide repeat protein [Sandaracinus amylolyticus]|uniref:Beta-lactamase n=1 Tax=Sandaracinus amylolyticus TaxID=927083 RepID=A0A0F6SFX5_9BACT|nr:sel1 repeat family protein [Sandaracinus amylolyticus]AKF07704.1 hypothetical protein DB32_004853 [Sandaracinus amylolyticus]
MQIRLGSLVVFVCLSACASAPSRQGAPARNASSLSAQACLADALPVAPAPQSFVWRDHECGFGGPACVGACEAGDADACLAHAYAIEAAGHDALRTRRWYERACRLGSLNGCTNWGAGFGTTDATPGELVCATRVFERTCAGREPWGCGMWGMALVYGRGIAADAQRGLAVLDRACRELGHFPCVVLATAIEERDPEAASALYERACATGYADACEP